MRWRRCCPKACRAGVHPSRSVSLRSINASFRPVTLEACEGRRQCRPVRAALPVRAVCVGGERAESKKHGDKHPACLARSMHICLVFLINCLYANLQTICTRSLLPEAESRVNRWSSMLKRKPYRPATSELPLGRVWLVFGEEHLRRILNAYAANGFRSHLSLGKDSPTHRPIQRLGKLVARPIRIRACASSLGCRSIDPQAASWIRACLKL